jgi:hypothetical protein
MKDQLLIPVDPKAVLLIALLNPAVVVVAFWLGRMANQWQKVPVAAFAGALAGSAAVYLAVWMGYLEAWTRSLAALLGMEYAAPVGRASAGIFIAQFLVGLAWAWIGYGTRRSSLLHLWLVGTAVLLAAIAIWAFVPVLALALLLTAGLGLLSLVMVVLARLLQRWREGAGPGDPTAGL